MKAVLYSTASAVALLAFAGAASAEAGFSGVAQLSIGRGSTDGSFFISPGTFDDPVTYGGEARGLWPLSPDIHLQADLFVEQVDDIAADWGTTTETTSFGGALHLLHPFENRARFGIVGSIWSNEVLVAAGNGQGDATYGLAGLEGQFFGTDWTLMGQTGLFTEFQCSDTGGEGCPFLLSDGIFLRGEVKYFLNDNTALSLEAVQMWGNVDDTFFGGKSLGVNSSHWTLGAEHRFQGSRFSGFINVTHENVEMDVFGAGTETTSASIGVKFYLDQASLRSNNRSGAELNAPRFGNALEHAAAIVEAVD
jgi:hypothetical protein